MSSPIYKQQPVRDTQVDNYIPMITPKLYEPANGSMVLEESLQDQNALRSHCLRGLRRSWACRRLQLHPGDQLDTRSDSPQAGDVIVAEVVKVGNHTRITLGDHRRTRLYPGNHLLGVMGNRYATDAFEGEVGSLEPLHMLTGAGMMGTVKAKHRETASPTCLRFLGYLTRDHGVRVNLKNELFTPTDSKQSISNVLLVVGTGMNSGKTTTATRLIKGLVEKNLRVAACKVTGSVSERDCMEMLATDAHDVRDFSDYGFPSTYCCDQRELFGLFETMVADSMQVDPDIIVMEIADGLLQRETQMLLASPEVRARVRGLVLAAGCASSALHGIGEVNRLGHIVTAVSGLITSSPLFMRELASQIDIPICCSAQVDSGFANLVAEQLDLQ